MYFNRYRRGSSANCLPRRNCVCQHSKDKRIFPRVLSTESYPQNFPLASRAHGLLIIRAEVSRLGNNQFMDIPLAVYKATRFLAIVHDTNIDTKFHLHLTSFRKSRIPRAAYLILNAGSLVLNRRQKSQTPSRSITREISERFTFQAMISMIAGKSLRFECYASNASQRLR